mgnify:CR=1 FL=1
MQNESQLTNNNIIEPLERCIDCVHWHRHADPNNPDAVDISTGSCDHNGYTKCPPLFSCNGWDNGNGEKIV